VNIFKKSAGIFWIIWSIILALWVFGNLGAASQIFIPLYLLLIPYLVFTRLLKSQNILVRNVSVALLVVMILIMLLMLALLLSADFYPPIWDRFLNIIKVTHR